MNSKTIKARKDNQHDARVENASLKGEGFESEIGRRVCVRCPLWQYEGILVGVSHEVLKLDDPYIIYDDAKPSEPGYSDRTKMGTEYHYIRLDAVESFGPSKVK